jgi:hypothetical protein
MKCSAAEVIGPMRIEPRLLFAVTKPMSGKIAAGDFAQSNYSSCVIV